MIDPSTDPRFRAFRISVPDDAVADLHRRLDATRWPAPTPGEGWATGVPLAYLRELAAAWREFDWRGAEARLNAVDQYQVRIDGVDVHVAVARSPHPQATPLVLTHGWPSSPAEFLDVVGRLTDPVAHGGSADEAFHVVTPSLPGYGFSGPLPDAGWDVERVARAWRELMAMLGCDRYVAAGGDWGAAVSLRLGEADPEHVVGVHVTMFPTFPPSDDPAVFADLDEGDLERLQFTLRFSEDGRGYQKIQSTRPRTLAYGLTDSPVGQLAWIAEKYKEWSDSSSAPEDAVARDAVLTQASVFWFTACAESSSAIYVASSPTDERFRETWGGPWCLHAPVGVAFFPADAVRPVRAWLRHTAPTLAHYTEFDRGGHFPALEQPELLVGDLRKFASQVVPAAVS